MRIATLIVPADVRSLLSVIERANDIASTVASAPQSHIGPGMVTPRRADGAQGIVAAVMREPLPVQTA